MTNHPCIQGERLTAVEVKSANNSRTINLLVGIFIANLAIAGVALFKAGTIVENVESISGNTEELKDSVLVVAELTKEVAVLKEKISWVEEQFITGMRK